MQVIFILQSQSVKFISTCKNKAYMTSNSYLIEVKVKNVQEQCTSLSKRQIQHDSQLAELRNKTNFIQTIVDKFSNFNNNQGQNLTNNNSSSSSALSEKKYYNQNLKKDSPDSFQRVMSIIKKMESNALINFQKVQSYINQSTQELNNKFDKVQSKLLNLLFQKQVILEQFSRNIQKHEFSIQAVENYLKNERQTQSNSIELFYSNLCQKIKVSEKNWELKQLNTLKDIQNVKLQVQSFKSDSCVNFQRISAALSDFQESNEQNLKKYASNFNYSSGTVNQEKQGVDQQQYQKLFQEMEALKKQNKDSKRSLTKVQNIIKELNSTIKQIQYAIQRIKNSADERMSSKQSEPVHKFTNKNDVRDKREKETQKYQRHGYSSIMGDEPKQQQIRGNRGLQKQQQIRGIRGLLKKSKQKEEPKFQQLNSKKLPKFPQQKQANPFQSMRQKSSSKLLRQKQKLSPLQRKPNSLKKQLPPVKQDPHAKKKMKEQNFDVIQLSSQNGEDQEYEVDQNGFLIDKYGQYVYGEDGNIMQLSEQYLQELLDQQNQQK